MADSLDYATSTAGDLAKALAARQVSAAELTDTAIAVIEARDGAVNAVVVRDFDRARDAAKAADAALGRGETGPLLGVPMTVKESHQIAGLPTTWGVPQHKGWTPTRDATGITRLKAAGAIILGKTNVPPMLSDWQSVNPIYGRTNNPLDLGRSPGGSSGGGSAALAAGMVPLEYGSDIGGSIRVPAHFCGVFGHKPTYGLNPITGHYPPTIEQGGMQREFSVVGPLARTASDLELAMGILAGPDGDMAKGYRLDLPSPRHGRLADYRVLVIDTHPLAETDAEVSGPIHRLAEALERAGAKVARSSDLVPDLAAAQGAYLPVLGATMGPSEVTLPIWIQSLTLQAAHRRQWAALFQEFDIVLAPPFITPAFPHDDEPDSSKRTLTVNGKPAPYMGGIVWPGLATFPGLPSTCAPIATTAGGLPTGVQIMGAWLEDRTTMAFAGLVEREIGRV